MLVYEGNVVLEELCHGVSAVFAAEGILLDEFVEALRLHELPDEFYVVVGVSLATLLLPQEVPIEVKEVITGEVGRVHLIVFLLKVLVKLYIIIHRHEQKVEEELFDRKLGIGPVLLFKMSLHLPFGH